MLFRVPKAARSKKRPPEGFIEPCVSTLAQKAPSGRWRMIARRRGGEVRLWTRQANEVAERFARIAAAVLALPRLGKFRDVI